VDNLAALVGYLWIDCGQCQMTSGAPAGLLVDNVDNLKIPIQWISHIYMDSWAQCYKLAVVVDKSILSTILIPRPPPAYFR